MSRESTGPGALRAGTSALRLNASVHATAATSVVIRVFYQRSGGAEVDLTRQEVPLSGAPQQQVPVTVDLDGCLADTQRAVAGADCVVMVELTLLGGTLTLDSQRVGPITLKSGEETAVSQPVALREVASITFTGGATTMVVPQQIITLAASPVDVSGNAVSNRTLTWSSSNSGVATVDQTGKVTGVAPGTATISAAAGGRTGSVQVSAVQTPQLIVAPDTVVAASALPGTTTTSSQVRQITSSNTFALAGVTATTTFTGTTSGWLTTSVSATTPGTVTLTFNPAGLGAGVYSARVLLASPLPGVAGRTLLVTYTVAGTLTVSDSAVILSAPPGSATPVSKTVQVSSAAGVGGLVASITYTSTGTAWLTATLSSATTPATLTLTANPTGLSVGTYTANVTITSTTPGIPPRVIPVTFGVTSVTAASCSGIGGTPAAARTISPTAPFFNGNQGNFVFAFNLGTQAQPITVEWDMFGIPDAIAICFRGQLLYDSVVPISNTGSRTITYPGSPGTNANDPAQSIFLFISIRADNAGTAWSVRVLGNYVAPSFSVPPTFSITPGIPMFVREAPAASTVTPDGAARRPE